MTDIKQFKLTNGDELVCEVIEWPGEDDDDDSQDIIVRNAYKIVAFESSPPGDRYYTFRPWMIYQQDPEMMQLINSYHVVGEANPSAKVIEHYLNAVKTENEDNEALQRRVEEYMAKLKAFVESAINANAAVGGDSDSNPKVIQFPSRKLH
jgi:hypothetical protein